MLTTSIVHRGDLHRVHPSRVIRLVRSRVTVASGGHRIRVVVALGGKALLRRRRPMTVENQRANVRTAVASRIFACVMLGVFTVAACGDSGGSRPSGGGTRPSVSVPSVAPTNGGSSSPDTTAPPVTNPPRTNPAPTSATATPTTRPAIIVVPGPTPTNAPQTATPSTVGPGASASPAVSTSDDSSSWWIWLIVAIAVAAAAIAGVAMMRRRRTREAAANAWRRDVGALLGDAKMARDVLDNASGGAIDPTRLQMLRGQVDAVGDRLARLAATAPDDTARARSTAVEQEFRGYLLALESEQLLRESAAAPSAQAVADVVATPQAHAAAANNAPPQHQALDPSAARTS